MRVLQLCNKPPLPANDGGALAMHAVTEGLLESGMEVRVLTVETKRHPFLKNQIPENYLQRTKTEAVFIDTEVKTIPALLNLFSSASYNISRFYAAEFESKLIQLLKAESFDIVQLESIYMGLYIPAIRKYSNAKIVLRAHNIEHWLWKRRTEKETNFLKRSWFSSLTRKLKKAEIEIASAVDAIVPITPEDKSFFTEHIPQKKIHVLPYAMHLPEITNEKMPELNSVFHIGAMDWDPNIHGVKWLVNECWPKISAANPDAKLYLAGRNLKKNDPEYAEKNIVVEGETADAHRFMAAYSVMTVPLFSGGGMRVKLVEAMAMSKAIVTTPVGAEGTGMVNEKHALIATDANEFAKAVLHLLNNPELAKRLGENARALAAAEFELKSATEKLIVFYQSLNR